MQKPQKPKFQGSWALTRRRAARGERPVAQPPRSTFFFFALTLASETRLSQVLSGAHSMNWGLCHVGSSWTDVWLRWAGMALGCCNKSASRSVVIGPCSSSTTGDGGVAASPLCQSTVWPCQCPPPFSRNGVGSNARASGPV